MNYFTEKDVRDAILDKMRAGQIRLRTVYEAVYEIEAYKRLELGDKEGAHWMESAVRGVVEPCYEDAPQDANSFWRLKVGHH